MGVFKTFPKFVYTSAVHQSMKCVKEQRICGKFCFRVGKTAAETHNILHEAYGDDAWS
jgi:hypothetical protein